MLGKLIEKLKRKLGIHEYVVSQGEPEQSVRFKLVPYYHKCVGCGDEFMTFKIQSKKEQS